MIIVQGLLACQFRQFGLSITTLVLEIVVAVVVLLRTDMGRLVIVLSST
jgi:hypothetical protein